MLSKKEIEKLCEMLQQGVDGLLPFSYGKKRKRVLEVIGIISAVKTILEISQPVTGNVIPLRKAA